MTVINRLIRQAKSDPPPDRLLIRPNQVNSIAEHIRGCTQHPVDIDLVRQWLITGEVKIRGIPLRVIGSDHDTVWPGTEAV